MEKRDGGECTRPRGAKVGGEGQTKKVNPSLGDGSGKGSISSVAMQNQGKTTEAKSPREGPQEPFVRIYKRGGTGKSKELGGRNEGEKSSMVNPDPG